MIIMMGTTLVSPPKSLSATQVRIFNALQGSPLPHYYNSPSELMFELFLREKIIESAIKLSDSGAEFNIFSGSRFNPDYWVKTMRGYALRPAVAPSVAIEDIFKNGKEYAFECSTAIVIIFYYAVLQSINRSAFHWLFPNLLVWDWNYDEDLRIITRRGTEFIPGDVLYFYNPDYGHPAWIGENTVYFGNDQYFGHGIGLGSKEEIIESLNSLRKENATRSAYLLSQYSRLDFNYLMRFAY